MRRAAWPTGPSCAGWSVIWSRDAGITQILDIGSGLPTQGNVHEVAQEINPSVRTIYVDNDPVVCIHGQALLADARTTEVVTADVRRPSEILGHPVVRQFIDFRQPVGLLMLAILHHITDIEEPAGFHGHPARRNAAGQLSGHFELPDARTGTG